MSAKQWQEGGGRAFDGDMIIVLELQQGRHAKKEREC